MTKRKTTAKFMAGVLAATIALTSIGANPAMAKPSTGVRILQGLAALYIVSRVLDNDNTPQAVQPQVTRRHGVVEPRHVEPRRRVEPRHRVVEPYRREVQPRNRPGRLPESCFRKFRTWDGVVRGYASRCMSNNAPHLDLPRTCKTRVSTDRGMRKIYRARCLRQHGYDVARRR